MRLKPKSCLDWKLYVIADFASLKGRSLEEVVLQVIEGGASVIQLRDKRSDDETLIKIAKSLLKLTRTKNIPLIINDRAEVARISGADGLHLGQEDGSLESARTILGEKAIIGRSTHTEEQAFGAAAQGFDYIGVGPVFQTPTKPSYEPVGLELVRFAAKNIHIPFVAIGGINQQNISLVREAGAKTVAVVRAVMADPNPKEAARKLILAYEK